MSTNKKRDKNIFEILSWTNKKYLHYWYYAEACTFCMSEKNTTRSSPIPVIIFRVHVQVNQNLLFFYNGYISIFGLILY